MSKAKILIVEDQMIISTNVRLLLKYNEYEVSGIATTGDEALNMIEESRPDLVLMDIALPGRIDGIEAAIIIKERWNIPIIYLTAHTEKSLVQRAKETAPYGFITKDIELKSQLPLLVEFSLFRYNMEIEHDKALKELQDSEEKFRSIANSAEDAIIFIDDFGKISFWNESATKIFGYSKEEAIGKEISGLIAPDLHYKYYKSGFSDFSENGNSDFIGKTIEIQARKKDGILFPIEISLSPVMLKGQRCACGIIRDVTVRKNTEEEMKKLIEELQNSRALIESHANELALLNYKLEESETHLKELNSSKDKFFSIISHDLKGPFQGLLGYSEILANSFDDLPKEEVKELAVELHQSAEHLYKLLENLLQWSRIQRGIIDFNPTNFRIADLAAINVSLLKSNASQKKIIMENNIEQDLWCFADVNMVNTVFRNLISNAIKFTKINGRILLTSEKSENNQIKISVSDNGIGIEQEDLDKLFKIDVQHSTTGTANEKGTGLGLVLCKELVEKNSGIISVNSRTNFGTTFSFTLPVGKNDFEIVEEDKVISKNN